MIDIPYESTRKLFKIEISDLERIRPETPTHMRLSSAGGVDPFRQGGQTEEKTVNKVSPVVAKEKPGRNDPCWCGSGKKYKKCHWPN